MTAPHTVAGHTAGIADVLDAAADLLTPEGAWTQGDWWSRNDNGDRCFCVRGALLQSGVGMDSQAEQDIAELMGFGAPFQLARWNDEPGRTPAEVVAKLRYAAYRARATAARSTNDMEGEGRDNG